MIFELMQKKIQDNISIIMNYSHFCLDFLNIITYMYEKSILVHYMHVFHFFYSHINIVNIA